MLENDSVREIHGRSAGHSLADVCYGLLARHALREQAGKLRVARNREREPVLRFGDPGV